MSARHAARARSSVSRVTLEYPDPELRDDVVALRRWEMTDLACVEAASLDPAIPAFTTVPAPYGELRGAGVHRAPVVAARQRRGDLARDRRCGDGEAHGCIVLFHRVGPQAGAVGLGYWVVPGARGRGLASHAVRVLAEWALRSPASRASRRSSSRPTPRRGGSSSVRASSARDTSAHTSASRTAEPTPSSTRCCAAIWAELRRTRARASSRGSRAPCRARARSSRRRPDTRPPAPPPPESQRQVSAAVSATGRIVRPASTARSTPTSKMWLASSSVGAAIGSSVQSAMPASPRNCSGIHVSSGSPPVASAHAAEELAHGRARRAVR